MPISEPKRLKAAIELEVFTAIGEGNVTAPDIAKRCGALRTWYTHPLRLSLHHGLPYKRQKQLQVDS